MASAPLPLEASPIAFGTDGWRGILGVDITIDGILGRQTLTALNAATLTAGLGTDADDHAKLAVIRSIGIPGSLDPDGPRPLQTTPDACGDGSSWVATPDDVLCLGSR